MPKGPARALLRAEPTDICAQPTSKYPEGRTGTAAGYSAHYTAAEPACTACADGRLRETRATIAVYGLQYRNGITLDEYDAMLAAQGGVCAICGTNEPGRFGRFVVDHDHTCCPGDRSCGQCARGLLCWACNVGLGHFADNVDRLTAAASYLMTHRGEQ